MSWTRRFAWGWLDLLLLVVALGFLVPLGERFIHSVYQAVSEIVKGIE
jgi:hypothetical protein